MSDSRKPEAAARLLLFCFSILSSTYALLCYIPFTWTQFLNSRIYPKWVGFFVQFHPVFFLGAAAMGVLGLYLSTHGALRSLRNRFYVIIQAIFVLIVIVYPLSSLANGPWALVFCVLFWAPLIHWEILLALDRGPALSWAPELSPGEDSRRLKAALAAALLVTAAYSGSRLLLAQSFGTAALVAAGWSLIAHLLVFLSAWALLEILRCAARLRPSPVLWESRAVLLLAGAALYLLVKKMVFGAVSFSGPASVLAAAAFAVGILAALVGQTVAFYSARRQPVEDVLYSLTVPLRRVLGLLPAAIPVRIALLAAFAGMPAVANLLLTGRDWNGLVETLFVVCVWVLAFALSHSWLSAKPFPLPRLLRPWVVVSLVLALVWSADLATSFFDHSLRLRGIIVSTALARQSEGDVSYRLARSLFRWKPSGKDFYPYLQRNTNISRETPVSPSEVRLVDAFGPGLKKKPNIFIIVVDSLRPDYLGAYNPKVNFTPAIDQFAAESLVWKNAFTAYGATGLSEPSIWAGSLLLHKQYVLPFHPMNSLEKLLQQDQYLRMITKDSVLTNILEFSPDIVPLDEHTAGNFLFCDSLTELSGKLSVLAAKAAPERPLFAYTQPQDIHVSVIGRAGKNNTTGGEYAGFYPPVASRVETMDRCFGRFISDLKRLKLYDESIVILTADHGDSLGEGGRWGHAYNIFPEILRVPILIRVPKPLLEGRVMDLEAPAFNLDITPTLYALLGHGPLNLDPLYGRTLLAADRVELEKGRKAEQMVVSSYGPVYGVLKNKGRNLYIIDGVNYETYYLDLNKESPASKNLVTPEQEAAGNAFIQKTVESLRKAYRFTP